MPAPIPLRKIISKKRKMKRKKNWIWLWGMLCSPLFFSACGGDDDEDLIGYWVRVSDFDGLARGEASAFSIGSKGYLVCGFDGSKNNTRMSDFWEYDMEMDSWTQLADFPGSARSKATAFSIDDKGYMGTGYNYTTETGETYLSDFWEYDPASNTWTRRADFPGSARYDAVSFAVDGQGYVGAGYDGNYLKDFYAYNPLSDTWTQIVSIGGTKRRGASSFVIDGVAYVCCGQNNGTYVDDFWKYDPSAGTWTQLRDLSDSSDEEYDDEYTSITRMYANTFVIDGVAYLTCGEAGSLIDTTWKYYPSSDQWEEVHAFKGSTRTEAVAFSNGERGFVATGKSGTTRFDDIWELKPYEYDPDDN